MPRVVPGTLSSSAGPSRDSPEPVPPRARVRDGCARDLRLHRDGPDPTRGRLHLGWPSPSSSVEPGSIRTSRHGCPSSSPRSWEDPVRLMPRQVVPRHACTAEWRSEYPGMEARAVPRRRETAPPRRAVLSDPFSGHGRLGRASSRASSPHKFRSVTARGRRDPASEPAGSRVTSHGVGRLVTSGQGWGCSSWGVWPRALAGPSRPRDGSPTTE